MSNKRITHAFSRVNLKDNYYFHESQLKQFQDKFKARLEADHISGRNRPGTTYVGSHPPPNLALKPGTGGKLTSSPISIFSYSSKVHMELTRQPIIIILGSDAGPSPKLAQKEKRLHPTSVVVATTCPASFLIYIIKH